MKHDHGECIEFAVTFQGIFEFLAFGIGHIFELKFAIDGESGAAVIQLFELADGSFHAERNLGKESW